MGNQKVSESAEERRQKQRWNAYKSFLRRKFGHRAKIISLEEYLHRVAIGLIGGGNIEKRLELFNRDRVAKGHLPVTERYFRTYCEEVDFYDT